MTACFSTACCIATPCVDSRTFPSLQNTHFQAHRRIHRTAQHGIGHWKHILRCSLCFALETCFAFSSRDCPRRLSGKQLPGNDKGKKEKKGKEGTKAASHGPRRDLPGARGTRPARGVIALVHIFTRPEALWVFALVNWAVSSHPLQSVAADDTPISVGLMGPAVVRVRDLGECVW